MKTIQAGGLAVAALLSLAGCGGPSDQPELGQVKGTVTLDGKPLGDTEVVFYPDSGRPARGRTDAEGKYELTYIRETPGTKVGHNRVEIAPSEEGGDVEAEVAAATQGETPAAKAGKPGKPVIPERYNSKSELEADVKPGENTFDFKLES